MQTISERYEDKPMQKPCISSPGCFSSTLWPNRVPESIFYFKTAFLESYAIYQNYSSHPLKIFGKNMQRFGQNRGEVDVEFEAAGGQTIIIYISVFCNYLEDSLQTPRFFKVQTSI